MCCKLVTVNHLQCIGVKRVVCFCLNQLIGTDIAERPIQDEDNTSKKMLSKIAMKIKPLIKKPFFSFANHVYVMQEGMNEAAKVGCTSNPKKRMSDLQGGNYRRLNYLLVIELKEKSNKLDAEKRAQKYLENNKYVTKFNLGGGTEWYNTEEYGIATVVEKVKETLTKSGDFKADVTHKFKSNLKK